MCNESLRFDMQPSVLSSQDIKPVEGLRVKDTADEGVITNSRAVEIGLLKGCLEDVLVTRALDPTMQVRPVLQRAGMIGYAGGFAPSCVRLFYGPGGCGSPGI